MSRNGSGTYSLPSGNPVVTGTTISSTWANNTLSDIANGLTQSISADGQTPITGPLIGSSGTVAFGGVGQTKIPSGTTAQRAASPTDGMIRYNTDLQQYEGYKNGAWSIFGNGAGGTLFSDTVTATQGQTLITMPTGYVLGGDNLSVYVNGSRQIYNVNYTETSTTSFTFSSGLNVGDLVNYTIGASTSLSVNSASVLYNEGGTGAVDTNVEAKLQQTVSVKDFGAVGDGTTDDTAAIQNALNSGAGSVYLPEGTYLFSTLTVNKNTRLYGASTRTSILKHTGVATAIQCVYAGSEPDDSSAYIDAGWFIFEDFELLANGTFGFRVGKTRSSFTMFNRLYIRHRQDGGAYTIGAVAIDCDNTPWISSYATYLSKIHHCLIRGFEVAVNLQDTVNSWEINRLWAISCLKQIVLSNATGINITDNYFESDIAGATGVVFLSGGGNQVNIIGTTFEFTNVAATQYAYSFAGSSWQNISVIGVKYLIQGDGNGVNNRRITGTPPNSFVELNRTYTSATYGTIPMLWGPGVNASTPFQLPNTIRSGGFQQGLGKILLGRNDVDSGDVSFEIDSLSNFKIKNSNNVNWLIGLGTPEGSVTASVGSLYTQTNGGANTTLYVKESGTGNTGWVAK